VNQRSEERARSEKDGVKSQTDQDKS